MGNIISRKQAAGQIRKTLESFYMLSRSVPGEGATGENDTPELERFFILCGKLGENIRKKEYDTVLDSLDAESFRAFYHTVGILAESYSLHNAKYFKENEPAGITGEDGYTNGNLYHYSGNSPIRYTDMDGRNPISWLIPDPEKLSTEEARNWIEKNVCANDIFPICREMYKKSLSGDNTDYVKEIGSFISNAMASDKKAYVNQRILNRLKNGITSGKNGQTGWSKADLKLSIGSATFSWKLKNYDSKNEKAVVEVYIKDNFDFNKGGSGVRSNDGEKLTALGRKAELSSYKVDITYLIEFKVKIPEEN